MTYLSHKAGNGTSHLVQHAKCYCKQRKKGGKDNKKLSQELGGQLARFKFNQKVNWQSLAKLIIYAELPFRLVEHLTFIEFVRSLQP